MTTLVTILKIDWNLLLNAIIGLIGAIAGSGLVAYAAIKVERMRVKKEKEAAESVDLFNEQTRYEISVITKDLGDKLDVYRCDTWGGHNGTKMIGGFHLMKLSMLTEYSRGQRSSVFEKCQDIPAYTFERILRLLSQSKDGYIITNENEYSDNLSGLLKFFGVKTFNCIRINDLKGRWIGLLSFGYNEEDKNISKEHISYAVMEAARIGALLSKN